MDEDVLAALTYSLDQDVDPIEGVEHYDGEWDLPGMWESSDFTGGLDEVRP